MGKGKILAQPRGDARAHEMDVPVFTHAYRGALLRAEIMEMAPEAPELCQMTSVRVGGRRALSYEPLTGCDRPGPPF